MFQIFQNGLWRFSTAKLNPSRAFHCTAPYRLNQYCTLTLRTFLCTYLHDASSQTNFSTNWFGKKGTWFGRCANITEVETVKIKLNISKSLINCRFINYNLMKVLQNWMKTSPWNTYQDFQVFLQFLTTSFIMCCRMIRLST